ncbi:hypothetical protein FGRMN_6896 [Fusarium graminum]|nr:hypothetical protein FGRMN_6896 [Fusarium graminum]
MALVELHARLDLQADRSSELNTTTTVVLVLSAFFVVLRFLSRYLRIGYGLDDWLSVVALFFVFVTGALNYALIAHGLGKHVEVVSEQDQVIFLKLLLTFENIYATTVMFVKLALLQMYLRIFPSRRFRQVSAVIAGVVIAWWIAICAVCIFQCDPIKKAWLPLIPGKCIKLKASFTGNAIPNITTDVVILCMPVKQIIKLQVNMAQKLSLLFIFLLGSFVLFASIYRFTTLLEFEVTDATWTLASSSAWCVIEVACGTIALCLPTLRPIILLVSSKFESLSASRKPPTDRSNVPTELITIGGTGGMKSGQRPFHRIHDGYDLNASQHGLGTASRSVTHMDSHGGSAGSADELPLKGDSSIR